VHESAHSLITRLSIVIAVILDSGHAMVAKQLMGLNGSSRCISVVHEFKSKNTDSPTEVLIGYGDHYKQSQLMYRDYVLRGELRQPMNVSRNARLQMYKSPMMLWEQIPLCLVGWWCCPLKELSRLSVPSTINLPITLVPISMQAMPIAGYTTYLSLHAICCSIFDQSFAVPRNVLSAAEGMQRFLMIECRWSAFQSCRTIAHASCHSSTRSARFSTIDATLVRLIISCVSKSSTCSIVCTRGVTTACCCSNPSIACHTTKP
jgi:hypothetical protein